MLFAIRDDDTSFFTRPEELTACYGVKRVGPCEGVEEHFFAIGTEKKVSHPLVQRLLPLRR